MSLDELDELLRDTQRELERLQAEAKKARGHVLDALRARLERLRSEKQELHARLELLADREKEAMKRPPSLDG